MAGFYFEREVRTPTSECYNILEEGRQVGRLDIHFASGMIHGTMIVAESVTQENIQDLAAIVDEDLLDAVGVERDDFVLHIHQGRDLGVYSNNELDAGPQNGGHPQGA